MSTSRTGQQFNDPRQEVINKIETILAVDWQKAKNAEQRTWMLAHIKNVCESLAHEYPKLINQDEFYQRVGVNRTEVDQVAA